MTGSRLGPGGFFMAAAFAWTSQYSLVPILKYPYEMEKKLFFCQLNNKNILASNTKIFTKIKTNQVEN
jgi:hypothetical protein